MNKSSKDMDSSHIPYIDGLRAIAVIAVIIYHLNSTWLPGGFTGVDIFFTISGFVVSLSTAKKRDLSPTNFVASFYARRILRIVPALLFCLILVSIAGVLFIPISWLGKIAVSVKYAFFGLSNLFFMQSSDKYFELKTEFNPFLHTWSLGVEEQFYLTFPILFYWWNIRAKNNRFKYISTSIFALFFACSITCAVWFSYTNTTFAFYSIITRYWELATGVILYQITAYKYNNSEISSGIKYLIGSYISLVIVILGFIFANSDHFPFPWALLPVFGTVGLLFFLHGVKNNRTNLVHRGLSNQLLEFIGRISYSLYLWHWPIFVLFRWTVGLESSLCYVIAIFLTFILAIASYYLVECPIRYSRKIRGLPNTKIIFVGLLSILMTWYMTIRQLFPHTAQLSLSIASKQDDLLLDDIKVSNKLRGNCFTETSVRNIKGGEVTSFSQPACPKKSPQLFVAGDSHAYFYQSILNKLTMETGINVNLYTKGDCPHIGLLVPIDMLAPECQLYHRSITTDILNHAQRGDIVFLTRLRRLTETWTLLPEEKAREGMFGRDALSKRDSATKEAITLLKQFSQRGIKVVFEAPTPIFRSPSLRCADWFNRMNPICKPGLEMQKDILINYRLPVMKSIQEISHQDSNVSVYDPFPVLCPGSICQAVVDHKFIFIDGDHLGSYGIMLVYPSFKTFIATLLSQEKAQAVQQAEQ